MEDTDQPEPGQLHQSYLRQLLREAPVAAARFDREMRCVAVNDRCLERLRIGASELIGRRLHEVVPGAPRRWQDGHRACLDGGSVAPQREILVRLDGSADAVSGQMMPWVGDDGVIAGSLLLIDWPQHQQHLEALEYLHELERASIANQLGAGIADELRTLRHGLAALRESADVGEWARGALDEFTALADGTLERLRQLVGELHPDGVDADGFVVRMRQLAGDIQITSGLSVEVATGHLPRALHPRLVQVMNEVASEALINVVRHAGATRAQLALEALDSTFRLQVSDDGIGIGEHDRFKPGCWGLVTLTGQLAQIGGTLCTMGVPGSGTTLRARAPIDHRGA